MQELIKKFYTSFQHLDADAMVSCYHPEIVYKDPAFGKLKGERVGNMWRMLCNNQRGKDFELEFSNVNCGKNKGTAHWEVFYTYGRTGRRIHNKIQAEFEFKDGLIIKHIDDFNMREWAKQALGFQGYLLGGTGFFRKKVQTEMRNILKKFENQ